MNRNQIDEQLRQRHRKAWHEARARWSPSRAARQWHRRRSGSAVESQRHQQSPLPDGTGCHASAFGSWSGGHATTPVFRTEPRETRVTVFEAGIITPRRPPRWWVVEQGI